MNLTDEKIEQVKGFFLYLFLKYCEKKGIKNPFLLDTIRKQFSEVKSLEEIPEFFTIYVKNVSFLKMLSIMLDLNNLASLLFSDSNRDKILNIVQPVVENVVSLEYSKRGNEEIKILKVKSEEKVNELQIAMERISKEFDYDLFAKKFDYEEFAKYITKTDKERVSKNIFLRNIEKDKNFTDE